MNIVTPRRGDFWAEVCELLEAEFTLKKQLWNTTGEVLVDRKLRITRFIDHILVEDLVKQLRAKVRLYEEQQDGDPYPRYKANLEGLEPFKLRQRLAKTRVMASLGSTTKGISLNRLVYAVANPAVDIFYDRGLYSEQRMEIAHLDARSFNDVASNLRLMKRSDHLAYDSSYWERQIPEQSFIEAMFEQQIDNLSYEELLLACS